MDYFEPKTISEALSLLAKYGEQAKVIAGGTDVMVDIKYKEEPGCLVNIKKIPGLGAIQQNGGSLRVGSLVTIREIETNSIVRERLPVFWEVLPSVRLAADPQHGHGWRQHLPSIAFGRNTGAAAGVGGEGQARFCRRRKERAVHVLLSGSGQKQRRRERSVDRNRDSLSASGQQKYLFEACSTRRHGHRHGRRRRLGYTRCRKERLTRCPHRSGRRRADTDSRDENRSDAPRQAAQCGARQRSCGDGRIRIEPDQRPA